MQRRIAYKVVPTSDSFVQEQHPEIPVDYYDEIYALVKFVNDKPREVIAFDGGEPEDNSFIRDWSWVPGALEQAYEEGFSRGFERGQPRDALDMD